MNDAIRNDASPTSGIKQGSSLLARVPKVVVVQANVDEGPMVENLAEGIESTEEVSPYPSTRTTTSSRSGFGGLRSVADTRATFPSSAILLTTLFAMMWLGVVQDAITVVCKTTYGHEILEKLNRLDEKTATADGTERRR